VGVIHGPIVKDLIFSAVAIGLVFLVAHSAQYV
jgi:hypothetical protein